MSNDWQAANPHDSRDTTTQAREVAEALFKPKQSRNPTETPLAASEGASVPAQPVARQPRIFTTTLARVSGQDRNAAVSPPEAEEPRGSRTREAQAITRSDHGRIRALVHYGMTPEQVADLYGVPVSRIERIARAG